MSSQIRISPEQMYARSAEYLVQAEAMNEIITKMSSLLTQLQSEWEGTASDTYVERYKELEPGFIQAETLITEIAAALKATAAAVEQTDADIASQFRV